MQLHHVIWDFCVCDVRTLQATLENEDKMFSDGKNIL